MAKMAKMSIGTPITSIPGVTRKHRKTRIDTVRRALTKAAAGQILPIYTGSPSSAANLAGIVRKEMTRLAAIVAVRRHIVYVQRAGTVDGLAAAPETTTTTAVVATQTA